MGSSDRKLNGELGAILNRIGAQNVPFLNNTLSETIGRRLPFTGDVGAKEDAAVYDCLTPLLSSYFMKLARLEKGIEEVCAGIAAGEAEVRKMVREQEQLLSETAEAFEEFGQQRLLFDEFYNMGEVGREDVDSLFKMLSLCPVDSASLRDLRAKLQVAEEENKRLENEIAKLDEEVSELTLTLQDKQITLTDINEAKRDPNEALLKQEQAQQELAEEKLRLEKLIGESRELQFELIKLKNQHDDLLEVSGKMEVELTKKEREIEAKTALETEKEERLRAKINDLEAKEEHLDLEINKRKKELEMAETENKEIEQRIKETEERIAESEQNLTSVNQQLKNATISKQRAEERAAEVARKTAESE